jgi:hypothetical protein
LEWHFPIIAYFIILTTGATLYAHGKTNINNDTEAAEALRPIAEPFTALLFSLEIIGTGLLALPVLGGSAAYAAGEALDGRWGLNAKRKKPKHFIRYRDRYFDRTDTKFHEIRSDKSSCLGGHHQLSNSGPCDVLYDAVGKPQESNG